MQLKWNIRNLWTGEFNFMWLKGQFYLINGFGNLLSSSGYDNRKF